MRLGLILLSAIALAARLLSAPATVAGKSQLRVGVAAVSITPFGPNPDWDGTITDSGVWGEKFQDLNHNGTMLAPAWACATAALLHGRMPEDAVCSEFHNGNPKTERSSPVGK